MANVPLVWTAQRIETAEWIKMGFDPTSVCQIILNEDGTVHSSYIQLVDRYPEYIELARIIGYIV